MATTPAFYQLQRLEAYHKSTDVRQTSGRGFGEGQAPRSHGDPAHWGQAALRLVRASTYLTKPSCAASIAPSSPSSSSLSCLSLATSSGCTGLGTPCRS